MAWIATDAANFTLCGLTAEEYEAIVNSHLQSGQTGAAVLAAEVANVTGTIRVNVLLSGRTPGPPGTIPPDLMGTFTDLLRRAVFARMPESVTKRFFTGERSQAALRGDELLVRISKTIGGLESAASNDSTPEGPGASLIGCPQPAWNNSSMNGL